MNPRVVVKNADGLFWAGHGIWTANELRALIFSSVAAAAYDAPRDNTLTFWVEGDDGVWRQVIDG